MRQTSLVAALSWMSENDTNCSKALDYITSPRSAIDHVLHDAFRAYLDCAWIENRIERCCIDPLIAMHVGASGG